MPLSQPRIGVLLHQPLRDRLFSPRSRARLESLGDVVWVDSVQPLSTEDACSLLKDCAVAVSSWKTPYPNAEIMQRCPNLKLWVHAAGSVKHFFGPHLDGREIMIASCAPTIASAVAEMVVGEIILGLRRVLLNAAANRAGSSTPIPDFGKVLSSSTVGVVGGSQVGRRVITFLQTFAPDILLYDPFVSKEEARHLNVRKSDNLVELCAQCDVVTLHTPHLPETTRLLKAEHFQAMNDDTVFINTSRGECIDEAALVAELQKGRLQAFLDVSAPEPATPDSPLRSLPNVVYTSHIAGEAETGIGDQVVSDITAWLHGEPPQLVVTADMLGRMA